MPCYNQVNYIRDSIDSVLDQTYKNIDLILIDNDSTDGTKEIIKEYEKKDTRIRALYHEKNKGLGFSFTEGMSIANGDFVAFISSDDLWDPKKLEMQVNILDSNKDFDVIHSNAHIIDENGKNSGKTIKELFRLNVKELSGEVFHIMTKKNICCTSTILFRKECLTTYSEFDSALRFAHDWWLYIMLAKKHKFYYVPNTLASYRIHSSNITKKIDWVYQDYIIIHSRLAEMDVDPKNHLISASLAASALGEVDKARSLIKEAKKKGSFNFYDNLLYLSIITFEDVHTPLLLLNRLKNSFLGLLYKIKN